MTETTDPRVLFVDDEPLVLSGLRRTLGPGFRIETATSGAEGLEQLQGSVEDPFAVVVSDMRMPGMDGAEFLQQAHRVHPDAVLMILSGQADLASTVQAVNNASLFRFLTKPCESAALRAAITDAARQFQLVRAERELLDQTLSGAVDVLVKILAIANPQAFSRAGRITSLVETAAVQLGLEDPWQVRLAALLSQIGCIAVPEQIIEQAQFGTTLSPQDRAIYATHPKVARDLVAEIPRLDRVAEWIGRQPVDLPEAARPLAPRPRAAENTGAASGSGPDAGEVLLHTAVAFVAALDAGSSPGSAVTLLEQVYPSAVVRALYTARTMLEQPTVPREVTVADIRIGMQLEQDVLTTTGMMLVRKGERVSDTLIHRLRNFAGSVGVLEPILILDRVTAAEPVPR